MIVMKLHDNLPSFLVIIISILALIFLCVFAPCLKSFPPRPYPLPREFFN